LRQPGIDGRPISFCSAARMLNERNIETPSGRGWAGSQLQRMLPRLGLTHPLGRLPRELVRARVRALWRKHPGMTGKQLVANLGLWRPLGIETARTLLNECRAAAAKRSASCKRIGWCLDRRTVARIRLHAIWKRHPQFTTRQVIKELGLKYSLPFNWVWMILRDCRRGHGRHGTKPSGKGRRFL
jgi:hypothetical protein